MVKIEKSERSSQIDLKIHTRLLCRRKLTFLPTIESVLLDKGSLLRRRLTHFSNSKYAVGFVAKFFRLSLCKVEEAPPVWLRLAAVKSYQVGECARILINVYPFAKVRDHLFPLSDNFRFFPLVLFVIRCLVRNI